jgi:hypothetical protein
MIDFMKITNHFFAAQAAPLCTGDIENADDQ